MLRTATTSDHTPDLGRNPGVEHLPPLRAAMAPAHDRSRAAEQGVLEP